MSGSAAEPLTRTHPSTAAQCISAGKKGASQPGGVWQPDLAGNTADSPVEYWGEFTTDIDQSALTNYTQFPWTPRGFSAGAWGGMGGILDG